jgi:hypothetical protein
VRAERAQYRIENGALVEGPRVLSQIINYSDDGRTRETNIYRGESVYRRTVETYRPNGSRESTTVYNQDGTEVSKVRYEYEAKGQSSSEVLYHPDGSVKERTNRVASESGLIQSTKTSGTGATLETSINTIDRSQPQVPNSPARKSDWTTTKEDGSRIQNIFEVDASGNRITQNIYYAADGSYIGKRIAQSDADAKRLEATQYFADGSVKNRSLETREYDSKRNLIKLMFYSWNPKLEKFEPLAVSYHTITYR